MAFAAEKLSSGLRFDFNKAVADTRRDFPEQTAKVTFIDLDAPDVREQMKKFEESLSEKGREELKHRRYENGDFLSPESMPSVWHTTDGQVLMMAYGSRKNFNEVEKIFYNPDDTAKHLYYTFMHELGHIVVKGASTSSNYAEHAADTFALVRGMQDGVLDKKDAKAIADGRDMLCWLNADITHVTSMSLDALIINPKMTNFTGLTPQQTAIIAAKHAETFSLNADWGGYNWMANAVSVLNWPTEMARNLRLEGLRDIATRADRTTLPFYYSARILITARDMKEAGNPLLADVDFKGEEWDKAFGRIDKAREKRDIGAKLAQDKPREKPTALQKWQARIKPLSI